MAASAGATPAASGSAEAPNQGMKRTRADLEDDRFVRASGRGFRGLNREKEGRWHGPFSFLQLADTQIGMIESFEKPKPGWDRELELCRASVNVINRLKPAFAIICGDLVDEWPDGDLEKRNRQIRDFKEVYSEINEDIPLVCLCGNHDVGNRPNSVTLEAYAKEFGDDYFSFWRSGVKCIVLNSGLFKDPADAMSEREAHLKWIHSELEEAKGAKHIVVFSHVSPFVYDYDEPENYFNLSIADRTELVAACKRAGVRIWFCGHYHRNAVARHEDLEVVTSGSVGTQLVDKPNASPVSRLGLDGFSGHAVGEEVSGLRVVRVLEDRIEHEWRTFADLKDMQAVDLDDPVCRSCTPSKIDAANGTAAAAASKI